MLLLLLILWMLILMLIVLMILLLLMMLGGSATSSIITITVPAALNHIAIIRVEQLYPFPHMRFEEELRRYKNVKNIVWCQEEPRNQGAWYQILHQLRQSLPENQDVLYAGRPPSASPAAGYYSMHIEQQRMLVDDALGQS